MKKTILFTAILMLTLTAFGQSKIKTNFTIEKAAPTLYLNGTSAAINFYNGDLLLQQSSNLLTLSGGNLSLGAHSLLMTGSLGATASRLTKGWFQDLEVTNTIIGRASWVTGLTLNSGTLTLQGGHALTFITTGPTSLTFPTTGTLATNPMTTAGDVVFGGISGVPTRLAGGTDGYILTMASGAPAWAVPTGGEYLAARVDSIVTVLADTMNIEALMQIDFDTDTVASQAYARGAINDTMTARMATATVGLAAADTNSYGGPTTRTFVESLLGSGSGLSAERLPFIIGTTTGAPTTADSTVTHANIAGKHIDVYRDGAKQYQNFTATNTVEGFRVNDGTITVNPLWQDGEQVLVDIIQPILWSYLSLEGQESSLLTDLNGYWALDESSGTTVTDATGTQNGTTNATVIAGKLGNGKYIDGINDAVAITHNDGIIPKGVDFSVSMWFYLDSLPSTVSGLEGYYLFNQLNTASPIEPHNIQIKATNDLFDCHSRNTSGTDYTVTNSSIISDSTWHHVVFVNRGNGQTLQLYIDGTDVSASAGTFTGTLFEGLSNTYFGHAYNGAAVFFRGRIDECGIWGRALTSGEVTTLWNSGNGKIYPFN